MLNFISNIRAKKRQACYQRNLQQAYSLSSSFPLGAEFEEQFAATGVT